MDRAMTIVERLCSVSGDRRPGGSGNDEAVDYVARCFRDSGWEVSLPSFDCLNWEGGDANVRIGERFIPLVASPYGLGVDTVAPIRIASTVDDLLSGDLTDSVLVVTGDLVSEPLTPKAFPFYGSEEHTRVIGILESARPGAIVAVTGKHPELCGALDPYPWIEDGDFEIPVAAVQHSDAVALLGSDNEIAHVSIEATRLPSTARNVIAQRGSAGPRVTVCAHVDTKPGTPGAVDNATGVAGLILLAESLSHHDTLPIGVELLAVNGEDHFAAPGEVAWLDRNDGLLDAIELFVNIDGAGYREGRTAYSLYNVHEQRSRHIKGVLDGIDDLVEGPLWYQSDHAIFAMQGRPALAFTTELIEEMLVEVFHSEHDTADQVAAERITSVASALESLIPSW